MLQPRVGSLHAGVSRQAPLLRSPSQMDEIINYLPSVDIGGLADRVGSSYIAALGAGQYKTNNNFMFRTTDMQRWVFLSLLGGGFEVRNLSNGTLASLTVGPWAQNYINGAPQLKTLQIADTVLLLSTATPAQCISTAGTPSASRAYYWVRKLSSVSQNFYVNTSTGSASFNYDGSGGAKTREWVAQGLQAACQASLSGVTITRVGSLLRFTGDPALIASLTGGNDWDETASVVIKGRVTNLTDLPSTGFHGEALLVDLGNDDAKSSYWVSYDKTTNSYKETSYLDNFVSTASWVQGSMPMRLHQTGVNSFELQPVDWVVRKTGDDTSNAPAPFSGQTITDMALWKGRLWFASQDWVVGSQPDDLFNFWQDSAREVVASDPVKVQAEADLGGVQHIMSFRDNLMVFLPGAQGSIDGSQPVKPDTAALGISTRYTVDPTCVPVVLGDVVQYTGTQEGRSVLWEYQYMQASENNSATDLSKHVPRYCPGSVQRLAGSAQAGRTFLWTPLAPDTLYVQTSYWQGNERKQNAWSKVQFSQITYIWNHWVSDGLLYVLGTLGGYLALFSVPVDSNLGENPQSDCRMDFKTPVQVTWNVTRNRSEVILPTGYYQATGLVILEPTSGGWWREHNATVVYDGTQWLCWFTEQVDTSKQYLIGLRMARSFRLSPFYPTNGDNQTPLGRLQVHKVYLDCLMAGDFTATVTRADRQAMVAQLSPRTIGTALDPVTGANTQYGIPFNAKGDKASLTISATTTSPMIVTGYTLAARYSNLFAN